jgi:anaerobic selenocysteine-containing dehydrogenase
MTTSQASQPQSQPSPSRFVRGACPHDCPDTCATITEVQDGKAIRFFADPDHPITQGWLCAKVRPYLDHVYHPDRLLHPLRRVGPKGSGEWQRISWDEAILEIASTWRGVIAEQGAAAILPYSYSGTLGLVENSVSATRLWNRMGASGLERSICDAAAFVAVNATLGARWAPDPRDVLHSKLVIIWGHNPASTSPHFVPLLREAQRNGAFVVVVDPRKTLTARSADLHLQPRPATDGALALGLMHVLFAEGLHDEPWLREHTLGWEELRERVADYPPARVAAITGIPEKAIVSLARRYGTTKPALLKFADGLQRHGNGGQTIRALCCLPAVVGQIGTRGGGLYYSQSGHLPWDDEAVGHASECPPTPRIVNMNRLGAALTGEIADPPIKALYVFNANPVTSTPNAGKTIEGLMRDDLFIVVHEQYLTDTAHYADIVLPATTQLEQSDLHRPYGHRHLQYNHQAIVPRGEAKSNWTVMRLPATALGYEEPWLHQSTEEVIAEILDATARTNDHLTGITLERLQVESTVPLHFSDDREVPFADGKFPTPSGKVELRCDAMREHGVDPLPGYVEPAEFAAVRSWDQDGQPPLVLLTGAAHHFVSSSFGNLERHAKKEGTPFIELSAHDAEARGIVDGQAVIVENGRGWCQLQAKISDDVTAGVAVAPKGYWGRRSPGGRNVNWLTSDDVADLGGQATFHSNLVSVRPLIDSQDSPLEHADPELALVAD